MRGSVLPGLLALGLAGCSGGGTVEAPSADSPKPAAATADSPFRLTDATAAAGIRFVHQNGATPVKYMPETLGSGVCLLDFDSDGWTDIYFVQSGPIPSDPSRVGRVGSTLYRNRGDLTFEDVTVRAGVGGTAYGMGCTVADVDNDGDPDLYVTNFGPNVLYRNNGDGTFTDVTREAGVGGDRWSASAAFGDADRDGRPDLYVTHYVDFAIDNNIYCGEKKAGYRTYCHPQNYNSVPDVYYRNLGGLRFRDASREAGIVDSSGKGLGVVWSDFDLDGADDIYVANDATPNFLFHNRGDGTFEEIAQKAGVALGENGMPHAGMGVAVADCDGDGRDDIFITNLSEENNTLYRNLGGNLFSDESFPSGLGSPSLLFLGFGTSFADLDLDADPDLLVANGHILDNVELFSDSITFEQVPQLFENRGGCRFREVGAASGDYFRRRDVGRGSAVSDLDHDGDLDLVINSNARPAHLLRNDTPRGGRHWLALGLVGRRGRDALGARVEIEAAGRRQVAEARSASSYLSQGDPVLLFGLDSASTADRVRIRWPGGAVQEIGSLSADRFYRIVEGEAAGPGAGTGQPWPR